MKRFPVFFLLLWMLSLGCQARVHHRGLTHGFLPAVLEELDELRVVLQANYTRGYVWEAVFNNQVISMKESVRRPLNSTDGKSCDTEMWFVGNSVQGTTDLTMNYRPQSGDKLPVRSVAMKVVSLQPYRGSRVFAAAAQATKPSHAASSAHSPQQAEAAATPTCGTGGEDGKVYLCPKNTTAKSPATSCSSPSCSQADCCMSPLGSIHVAAKPTCGTGGKDGKVYLCPKNTTAKSPTTACSSLSCSQADCCMSPLGCGLFDVCCHFTYHTHGTTFCLVNFAGRRITRTAISEVDNYDWDGDSRPDRNLDGKSLADGDSICVHMELNGCAYSSWFRLTVSFEGSGSATMRLDQYWSRVVGWRSLEASSTVPGITAFHHCGSDTQTVYIRDAEPDLSWWMGVAQAFNRDVRLSDLVIPLTHDAGMSEATTCTDASPGEWTRTQALDLGQQLRAGVRAFDLRPCYRENRLWWCHFNNLPLLGFRGCTGLRVEDSLKQIKDFLVANPTETVLLEITHTSDDNPSNKADTVNRVLDAVSNTLDPVLYKDSQLRSLDNLLLSTLAGKAVVVFGSEYPGTRISPGKGLHRLHNEYTQSISDGVNLFDEYSNSDNPAYMRETQLFKLNSNSQGLGKPKLFLLSWTLTANLGGTKDIVALSATCNGRLPTEIMQWKGSAKKPNLIGMDFINPWLGRAIVGLNKLSPGVPSLVWTSLTAAAASSGSIYTPRSDHCTAAFRGSLYLAGGKNSANTFFPEVWVSPDGVHWSRAPGSAASLPVALVFHQCLPVNDQALLVLQGYTKTARSTGIYSMRASSSFSSWDSVGGNAVPSARGDHAAVFFGDAVWVFGGSTDNGFSNDIWSSSNLGGSWSRASPSGIIFGSRNGHKAVVFKSAVFLVGGYGKPFNTIVTFGNTWLNDVWKSTSPGTTWTQVFSTTSVFTPREKFGLVTYFGRLWVFFGCQAMAGNFFSDAWSSPDGSEWVQSSITTAGGASAPVARSSFGESVALGQTIFTLGGYPIQSPSDVWSSTAPAYLGCYRDAAARDLPFLGASSSSTPGLCLDRCRAAGYAYAAVQFYGECRCGNSFGRYGASTDCNTQCNADPSKICGGLWANSVYVV